VNFTATSAEVTDTDFQPEQRVNNVKNVDIKYAKQENTGKDLTMGSQYK